MAIKHCPQRQMVQLVALKQGGDKKKKSKGWSVVFSDGFM